MKTKIPYSGRVLDSPRHLLFRKIFTSTGLKTSKIGRPACWDFRKIHSFASLSRSNGKGIE